MLTDNLPKTGFLSEASDTLLEMLMSLATEVKLDTGAVLFEQGDEARELYALLSGVLEISVLSLDGRKLALNMLHPGALFGEIALFDPGERTATVTALEPCVLRRVRYDDVLDQVREEPDLAIDLIHLAGQRMRWMDRQLNDQVFLPMPTRLARKILYLTERPEGEVGTLALSQSELAEFVGATREAVSKTLSIWKKMGVVDSSRGALMVVDRPALQALADPDQI
ncbi:Crp/Fnr family transcriptional regulator [Seohaeicola zhoushanensis]|uniref:Crp/Fnr family transcriptional regulator n=1 Tax=Seohaeicola zhoushanensis TaxID=1569283 RepID=A0A8J3M9J2_9RHOB|nr:Crp/Fnr family transcriptional regulator [Seohaeicola zhoushanensis]GHF61410.1 Crp/Fnr family transcriptional regulator [Seohaeicola zhoushanensis]